MVDRLKLNYAHFATQLSDAGFTLSPSDSGPYALAAAPLAYQEAINSCLLAETVGVLMMDASYFFHISDEWVGFRLNLCTTRRATSLAIDRVRKYFSHTAKHTSRHGVVHEPPV
jgi:hypothetical protein